MMTMSASAQVYKIDNVDIYSFGTLESLKEFVAKQKLTGYESKIPPPPTKTSKCSSSSSSQPQTRYNTRRSKLKRLPASSESSFSPSSSSSYEDKKGCVKPSSSPLSSSEERESGIGSSSSTHSSSWLDDDCSTLDDYLIKLDECLPVSSPRTLNDESHLDMNLDESTTTTTPPPPPTSSSKRNGDSTSDDDEIMVWEPNANSPTCGKAHCRLGCICPPDEFSSQQQTSQQQQQQTSSSPVSNKSTASSSSSATSMQSQHCGRYECMFECLCSRRLRSSTRSNRSTVANDIVLPPASEANATSSATTTYSIGTRRREASVSSTNSIFSNSSLPYASNSRSSQLCKSPKSFRDDYYYYDRTTTNLGVSSSPSKYLNNSKSQRQNNSNQTSNSNMTASKQTGKTTPTQQQQQQKATVTKIQPKPVAATKTNTTAEFKPYTHRMLLQAKPMLIAGKQSILNDIPLIIEVFTAKWKREPPIAKKCLKLLWKLLNVLAYQSVNWREIEFDYERELTVRLAAVSEKNVAARSSPIRVRIMKFTPTKPANEDSSKFREIPKGLSGLQNGRYIVRECDNIPLKISFKENRPQQQLDLVKKEKSETNELVASPHFKENFFFPKSTIAENSVTALCQSFSPVKSTSAEAASLNWSSPKGRYLPRVLCRSRPSYNQSSSSNNSPSNRTSEIFKSLDTLFEKNNIYARHNQPQETPKKEKPLTAIMDANYHEACQLVDSEEIVKSVNDLLNDLVSTVAAATSLPSPQSKKDIIVLNKNSENTNTNNQSNALVRKVVQLVKPPILKSSFLPIKPKPSQTTQPIYKVSLLPTPIMNKVRTGPVKIAPRPPSWSSDHSNKKRDFSELNDSEREEYLAHRKRKRKQDLSAIPSGRISANPTPSPTPTTTTTTLRLVDVGAASYDDSSSISSSNLSSPNAVAVVAATATSSSSNTNTSIKTQSSPLIISTSSLFKSRGQTSSSARKLSYSDNTSEENSNSNNMTQEDLDEEEEEREEINYEDEEIDELEMDLDDEEGENDTQQFKQGRGRGRPRRDESLSLSFSSAPRNRSSISCSYSSDSDGEEGEGSKSGEYRKTIPPNIHSLRERERRSRLKTLLTKLQLAFLESSEESESPGEWLIKANRMFKVRASKQAILHEAVHQIKVAERNERLLQQEREAELRRNISLKNILQSLTNRA